MALIRKLARRHVYWIQTKRSLTSMVIEIGFQNLINTIIIFLQKHILSLDILGCASEKHGQYPRIFYHFLRLTYLNKK